jgi:type VI secretion system TssD-like protein
MARRPILEVDGVAYKNVYQISYELYTSKDETGRPTDRAHAGLIKVTRESDENSDISRWAMDSSQPNWKAGKIIFKDPKSESTMKELTWEEGFITKYVETIPHVKMNPDDQVFEYFEISCHRLAIGDAQIDNRWEE